MRILDRARACMLARAFVTVLGLVLGGLGTASAQDLQLDLVWLDSDDPGSGGVLTEQLAASPGDTGTLGLFLTPGPAGIGGYDLSFEFDADLGNGLDLLSVSHTPPAGWTAGVAPTVVESDATRAGAVSGFSAQGVGAPPIVDDPVQIGELRFRLASGIPRDSAISLTPDVQGFSLGSGQPGDLASAQANPAGATRQSAENEPSFGPAWGTYRLPHDLGGIRIRTAPICAEACDAPTRGAVLRSTTDGGFGFFQGGFEPGVEYEATVLVDATELDTPGAMGGVEFDSPAVPIGVVPSRFFFVGASRALDGSLTVFANDSGTQVGTPASFDDDEIEVTWGYLLGQVTIRAGAVGEPERETIVDGYPFAWMGSGLLGFGLSNSGKGDELGLTYEVNGDLYAAPRKKLLSELAEVIELERKAEQALDAGDRAKAQKLLEKAKERIEKGKQVPGSKPPRYVDSLIDQVDAAVPDKKTRDAIKKKLKKVAAKDGKAIDQLKKGGKAEKIKKYLRSATKRKLQAKAMIQTANRKEKGKTL